MITKITYGNLVGRPQITSRMFRNKFKLRVKFLSIIRHKTF